MLKAFLRAINILEKPTYQRNYESRKKTARELLRDHSPDELLRSNYEYPSALDGFNEGFRKVCNHAKRERY